MYSVNGVTTDAAGSAGGWVDGAVNAFDSSYDGGDDDWKWILAVGGEDVGATTDGQDGDLVGLLFDSGAHISVCTRSSPITCATNR